MAEYKHMEKLVSTQWVQEHMNDKNIIIIESNEDVLLYETGHVPGAIKIDWHTDLNNPITRDYLNGNNFSKLMKRKGITRDSTVVFYGDKSNWWAAYALWVFELFGHTNTKLMNGGRNLWISEKRPMTKENPVSKSINYPVVDRNDSKIRIYRSSLIGNIKKSHIIDVRSHQEYTGERTHMPDYLDEGALRGGHIPGALSIPWAQAVNENGTFKDVESLDNIYIKNTNISQNDKVVVYCRIGERSAHTWFVLKYLIGFKDVKNYDGSWTEYGNMVRVPIAIGPLPGSIN